MNGEPSFLLLFFNGLLCRPSTLPYLHISQLPDSDKIVPSEELANDEHSVERRVQGIYIHPLYQKNVNHDYDFALIRLDKAVPINRCLADLLTSWEEVAKRSCPREW